MKKIIYHSLFLLIIASFISCNKKDDFKKENFAITLNHQASKIHIDDELKISISNKSTLKVDSVSYAYNDKHIKTALGNKPVKFSLETPLGKRDLTAEIFYQGQSIRLTKSIVLHTNKSPKVYTYKVINTYPHDEHAFTQGLEFYQDTLYEGTGLHGVSSLRKVDLKTGKVLKEIKLDRQYFGEGITIMNDKIYQLTWQAGIGFIYDVKTFKKLKTFKYKNSQEGWGLCNDGQVIYKSDGTNQIWILDPETLEEKYYIEPVTKKALATKVNELEWVNGKIYANTWMKDGVLIIDPKSGAVEGVIDFRGLKNKLGNKAKADVLNGIAYDKKNDKLYVTGKKWDKLFEVEIIEK